MSKKKIDTDSSGQKPTEKQKKGLSKRTVWTLKITIITFALSGFFSFLTEITSSSSNIIIACLLLLLLIVINIVFDGIGVAATSCDLPPLLAMAARKVPGAAVAVKLVRNAEKVSNICCDVLGDICGIISGSCTIAILMKIPLGEELWLNILLSAAVAALTVGGKAFNKDMAIKNSKDVIMLASRLIGIFYKPDKKKNKKKKKSNANKGAKSKIESSDRKAINFKASEPAKNNATTEFEKELPHED